MSGLGVEGERAWTDLESHLAWVDGPWLAFLFTRGTAAAREIQRRVGEVLAASDQEARVMRPRSPQQLRELLPLLLVESTTAVTWIEAVHIDPAVDGDPGPWVEAWDWFMLRANERREQLLTAVGGGLIIAAPVALKERFREAAPDLWSVRSLVLRADPATGEPATVAEEDAPTLEVDAVLAQGWVSEAAPLAQEALQRAQARLAVRPADRTAQARLAEAWEKLARVRRDQGDIDNGVNALEEALALREHLAEGAPSRRRRRRSELARTLCLLGQAQLDRGAVDEADASLTRSVEIRWQLSKDSSDPETLAELALSVSLSADVQRMRGDLDQALRLATDALVLRQHAAGASDVARHRRWLSVAWGRLGSARLSIGDRVGARAAWREAWQIMRELAERDPGNVGWQMEASVAGCRWGDAAFADEEFDLAERAWTDAVELREQLAGQDPANARWQELLAVALGRMARLNAARRSWSEAASLAHRAAEISSALVELHPGHAGWVRGLERARARVEEIRLGREADRAPPTL